MLNMGLADRIKTSLYIVQDTAINFSSGVRSLMIFFT